MDLSSPIVHYPHPTLRHRAKTVQRIDSELRTVIEGMFPLMYQARGIGLAANQVDLPLRLFIINLSADPAEGEELVFINPEISLPKGNSEQEEGCLSMPGINAPVRRPDRVRIQAYNLSGELFDATVDGMMARAVQHELDHLDGVLFTDRLSETGKIVIRDGLEELELAFQSGRETESIPSDAEIQARLRDIEERYATR